MKSSVFTSHLTLPAYAALLAGAGLGLVLSGLAFGVAVRADAQPNAPTAPAKASVVPSLQAFKVTRQNEKDVFVPATSARPGDVIEYRAGYQNTSAAPVRDLAATLPIPFGTAYLASSAAPSAATASLDGRVFAPMPLKRTVKTAQGERTVVVPLSQYRYVRWQIAQLAPGETRRLTARVRVIGE